MAYRNDIEALEARHRALEADLAGRVRERDEVAQMLAEARLSQDRIDGRSRQRARDRRIVIAVVATIAIILTGVGYSVFTRHRTRPMDVVFAQFSTYAEQMCLCKTKACADGVTSELARWGENVAKETATSERPDENDIKRFTEVTRRYGDCLGKLQSN